MDLGLADKKVLVTGGTRGIGRAIALKLAEEKAHVAVIARSASRLKGVTCVTCDLTQKGAPKWAADQVRQKIGAPDIIINNIGDTLGVTDPFCSLRDWRKVFRINFEIAVELNQICVGHMKKQGWGRIVHIASNASLENSGPVTYCVTKAALAAYSVSLGRELAGDGVIVSSILPGAIIAKGSYWDRTSMTRPDHFQRYIAERLPLGRFGSPEEISGMVAFLCAPQGAAFFGNNIGVDGGQSKHFFGLY